MQSISYNDADGLTREWFRLLSNGIIVQRIKEDALEPESLRPEDKKEPKPVKKEPELFSAAEYSVTYQPNPLSRVHTSFYRFIGHLVAFALSSNNILDVTFTPSFYKHMTGAEITYHDMETMDCVLYNGWKKLLQNPEELVSMGLWFRDSETAVTKENVQKYIDEEANYYMTRAIEEKLSAFLEGLYDLIPKKLVAIFNAEELRVAMSGMPTIDVRALEQTADYQNYVRDDIVIQWFWDVLESFEHGDKAKFLGFLTGTQRVPSEGLKLTIIKSADPKKLPVGHTCSKVLELPVYTSKEDLKEKLQKAIHGCDSFTFR
ncbi:hypothetical protein Bca4012_036350 [Brassica carinata]